MSAPRTILVTRPGEDAGPLALRLEILGHRTVLEPLLAIRHLAAPVDFEGVQALAFTSANGVRALAQAAGDRLPRGLPVFAVGTATAAAARAAGFGRVTVAGGDVDSLAAAIAAELSPTAGAVLHVAGRDRAGDLAGMLGAAGFEARRAVLYAADVATELTAATVAALRAGEIDDVAVFSPRTARQFVTLVEQGGLRAEASRLRLLALSARVAEAASGIPFAAVAIAERPDEDALVALLDAVDSEGADRVMSGSDAGTDTELNPAAAAPRPAAAGARPRGGRAGRIALAAFLSVLTLAVAAAVVVAADPVLRNRVLRLAGVTDAAPAPTADEAVLRRLDALAADVAALRTRPQVAPMPGPAPAADPARLDALARGLGDIAARLDDLARKADEQGRRLAALEAATSKEGGSAAAAPSAAAQPAAVADGKTLALVALVAALDAGRPFAAELPGARAALAVLGPAAVPRLAALEAITPRAAAGIPTAPMLAARAAALRLAPRAEAAVGDPARPDPAVTAPPGAAGIWDRVLARLSGLVTIRRIDEAPASDPVGTELAAAAPPAATDAARLFGMGDVAAALALLRAIDSTRLAAPSAEALAALIADGEARRAADTVVTGALAAATAAATPADPAAPAAR